MPNPWPWALHPLIQFPFVLTLETAGGCCRRSITPRTACSAGGANNWYANETGGKDAEFKPVEEFRR